jgi:exodeoxyribonuclease VII large subunit
LGENAGRLDALSPLKTLSRGFAVASKDEKLVLGVKELKNDDLIDITFADGKVKTQVKEIKVN